MIRVNVSHVPDTTLCLPTLFISIIRALAKAGLGFYLLCD